MISVSSVLMAIICYSLLLEFIYLMCQNMKFMKAGGGFLLLLLAIVAAARMVLPIEIPIISHPLCSWFILGSVVKFLRTYPVMIQLLVTVWGVKAFIVIREDVLELYNSRKISRNYVIEEDELVQQVAKECSVKCPVVVSRDVENVYVAGFLRHTIYLPVLNLPEERLKHVLLHENVHVCGHHSLIKLVFGLVSAAMWWNPIAQKSRRTIDVLLEHYSDARVTEKMNEKERIAYGETLIAVGRQGAKRRKVPALALDEFAAVGDDEELLRQRITVLAYGRSKPPRLTSLASVCVMLALFCASYLVIVQPANMPWEEKFEEGTGVYYPEDYNELEMDDEISSEFIIKGTDGRYELFIDYRFIAFLTEDEVNSGQYQNLQIFKEGKKK